MGLGGVYEVEEFHCEHDFSQELCSALSNPYLNQYPVSRIMGACSLALCCVLVHFAFCVEECARVSPLCVCSAIINIELLHLRVTDFKHSFRLCDKHVSISNSPLLIVV
jgi:hypothetical protein